MKSAIIVTKFFDETFRGFFYKLMIGLGPMSSMISTPFRRVSLEGITLSILAMLLTIHPVLALSERTTTRATWPKTFFLSLSFVTKLQLSFPHCSICPSKLRSKLQTTICTYSFYMRIHYKISNELSRKQKWNKVVHHRGEFIVLLTYVFCFI